jgi:HEAT repeat protein
MDWIGAFSSGDEQRAESAALSLAQAGAQALAVITELVHHPEAEVRWWTVRALGEMTLSESGRLLAERMADEDATVRQCAAAALRQRPALEALPALFTALEDEDALLARLAADALIALGKPALPGLVEVLRGESPTARQQAVRCLAKIADPEAIPALFEALDDPSAWVRYFADEGLERMGVGMTFFKPQ